jgi:thiamine-phosphate pyrophosphorylase
MRRVIDGFYAVLDRDDDELARALLGGGARVLQIRLKPRGEVVDATTILRVAELARRLCDDAGAQLIVNDRVDLALAAGADGVHLGQTDLPIAAARAIAGDRLIIGVSTHDVAQVRAACAAGADYLGFGPVFATETKLNPDPVQGISGLREAVTAARHVPIVAIGGISLDDAAAIYATGAAAICAIRAVNEASDVGRAARSLGRHSGPAET